MSDEVMEFNFLDEYIPKPDKSIRKAYADVRSDLSDTQWAVFKHEDGELGCSALGSDFDEFKEQFGDEERAFAFIRLKVGDEISKRTKFLFLTWLGKNVGVINRAKMSADKPLIKAIISNFSLELLVENQDEIDIDYFKDQLIRAGGANYGIFQ